MGERAGDRDKDEEEWVIRKAGGKEGLGMESIGQVLWDINSKIREILQNERPKVPR